MIFNMRKGIAAHIAELKACKAQDLILVWPGTIGIMFVDGRAVGCRLHEAQGFQPSDNPPLPKSGYGKPARLVCRQKAILDELVVLESMMFGFQVAQQNFPRPRP